MRARSLFQLPVFVIGARGLWQGQSMGFTAVPSFCLT